MSRTTPFIRPMSVAHPAPSAVRQCRTCGRAMDRLAQEGPFCSAKCRKIEAECRPSASSPAKASAKAEGWSEFIPG